MLTHVCAYVYQLLSSGFSVFLASPSSLLFESPFPAIPQPYADVSGNTYGAIMIQATTGGVQFWNHLQECAVGYMIACHMLHTHGSTVADHAHANAHPSHPSRPSRPSPCRIQSNRVSSPMTCLGDTLVLLNTSISTSSLDPMLFPSDNLFFRLNMPQLRGVFPVIVYPVKPQDVTEWEMDMWEPTTQQCKPLPSRTQVGYRMPTKYGMRDT